MAGYLINGTDSIVNISLVIWCNNDSVIANVENTTLHKYTVYNGRSVWGVISEIVGNSFLLWSQNSFNIIFYETKVSNSNTILKIKQSNIIQSKDTLT